MSDIFIPEASQKVFSRTSKQEVIEEKFIRAGHKPENRACNHMHYDFQNMADSVHAVQLWLIL